MRDGCTRELATLALDDANEATNGKAMGAKKMIGGDLGGA